MSREPRVTTQKRRNEMFRYGQAYDNSKITFMIDRNPYAYRLTYGVVRDAIGKGIKTIEKETEKDKTWSKDMWEVLKKEWKTLEKYFGDERGFRKALFMVRETNNETVLRSFTPKDYSVAYDKHYNIVKMNATEYIGGSEAMSILHQIPANIDSGVVDEKFDLDSLYELIIRESDRKGEGKSVLQPVWDTLFSLMMLDEHATYFVIRVGGGLKIIKVPEDKLNDAKYMAKIRNAVEGVNSGNGVMIIPTVNVAGTNVQDLTFELLSGELIDFLAVRDLLLGSLAAATGIPREVWLGSELGLRSSETNQSNYFSVLQDIQDDYRPFLEWLIRKLNKKHKWFGEEEEFDIEFIARSEMTDRQKMELWNIKGDILSKFHGKIDDKELAKIIGVKKILEKEDPIPFGQNPMDPKDDKKDDDKKKPEVKDDDDE